jgi:type VI secretion system secreted protein VgrG
LDSLEEFPFDQTERVISVESFAAGEKKICVISFSGVEQLSTLSRFRLEVVTRGRALKPSEALGQKLGVAIRFRKEVRKFHGVISRFEVLRTSVRGHHLHLFELSPPAWLMGLNQRFRIFEEKASHEIVSQVTNEASVQADIMSLGNTREYWVQYGESDLAFISRLLEEDGQFYRFDHSSPDCTMIGGDGKSSYTAAAHEELEYGDFLTSWQPQYRIGPSAFKHGAWDYQSVASMQETANGLPKTQPPGLEERQFFEFPGRHETGAEASRLSEIRMAEREAQLVAINGSSTTPTMEVAAKFKVRDHVLDMPASGETSDTYVVTRVDHRARDASGLPFDGDRDYDNSFACMPADLDFRPPRVTPRPYARGPQTGMVTDTPDDQGRARVQFPWEDQGVSRWVRVAQTWAYDKMGTQFLPRVGSEVVVEFLHGDPDHPIIVGMVYNGNNSLLYDQPGKKTQSGVRGANWGDSGVPDTSNELRFEDQEGSEEIYIHAQKDFRRVVVNDDNLQVQQGNRTLEIQQGNVKETLSMGDHDLNIDMGKSTVDAMQSITMTVGQSSITIDQKGVTIKGMMISIEGQITVDVKALLTTVKADALLTLKGGITMIN